MKPSEITEAYKQPFEVYHSSYTSAINTALDYAAKRGFQPIPEEVGNKIGLGPKKPGEGKQVRIQLGLTKNGKAVGQQLVIIVDHLKYAQATRQSEPTQLRPYELTCYIS